LNLRDVIAVPTAVVATKGAQTDLAGAQEKLEELSSVPPAGGVTRVIMESHGIASAVSSEADRSQQWATEEPEKISAVPPVDGVMIHHQAYHMRLMEATDAEVHLVT
jgi:hypothetical protein